MPEKNENDPDIWVMTITYNQEKFIGECLESLVNQTLRPSRIFVSDDCSTDGTWAIIEQYMEKYPQLVVGYRQPRNLGAVENTVFLFSQIQGRHYCLMEGDDWWAHQKLEREWQGLKSNPQARIAYSNVMMTDERGENKETYHDPRTPLVEGDIFFRIATRTMFNQTGSCCRNYLVETSCLHEIGYEHDTSLPSLNDYDIHLTLSANFHFAGSTTSEPMVFYRRHDQGMSVEQDKVTIASEMIYVKHDKDFTRLPVQQEIVARLKQERLIAINNFIHNVLPADKSSYYAPGHVLDRFKRRLQEVPEVTRDRIWGLCQEMARELGLMQIKKDMDQSEDQKALRMWLECYSTDNHPLDAWFSLSEEMFGRLQKTYKEFMNNDE